MDPKTRINHVMEKYIDHILNISNNLNEHKTRVFTKEALPEFNSRVHGENYYMKDIFGIVIRKSECNKENSPFGWVFLRKPNEVDTDGVPVSIFAISRGLIELGSYPDEDPALCETIGQTIKAYLRVKYKSQFKPPKEMLYRMYDAPAATGKS